MREEERVYMTIDEIKRILQRKAVIFETGGFKPTNEIGESWIGAVKWKKQWMKFLRILMELKI